MHGSSFSRISKWKSCEITTWSCQNLVDIDFKCMEQFEISSACFNSKSWSEQSIREYAKVIRRWGSGMSGQEFQHLGMPSAIVFVARSARTRFCDFEMSPVLFHQFPLDDSVFMRSSNAFPWLLCVGRANPLCARAISFVRAMFFVVASICGSNIQNSFIVPPYLLTRKTNVPLLVFHCLSWSVAKCEFRRRFSTQLGLDPLFAT